MIFFPSSFQSGSPLRELINEEILVLDRSGLPVHWLYSQMPNATKCHNIEAIKESNVDLPAVLGPVEMFGLFLVSVIGKYLLHIIN